MERAALKDFHFSLHVPVSAWVDHVNKAFTALITKDSVDEIDSIAIPILDQMVTEAREAELCDPRSLASLPNHERRLSAQLFPAAADQALSRDWGSFARTYAINDNDFGAPDRRSSREIIAEMEMAERTVSALVDDDNTDDEEEFLDYDGAKRWLPSMFESRRSASHSSLKSFDSFQDVDQWRTAVRPEVLRGGPGYVTSTHRSSWDNHAYHAQGIASHSAYFGAEHSAGPHAETVNTCPQCGCDRHGYDAIRTHAMSHPRSAGSATYNDTGVYLEPGISIVRPPISAPHRIANPAKQWA